jgi:hypothetical protein
MGVTHARHTHTDPVGSDSLAHNAHCCNTTGDIQSGKGLLRRIPPINIEEQIVDAAYPTKAEYKVINPGERLCLLSTQTDRHTQTHIKHTHTHTLTLTHTHTHTYDELRRDDGSSDCSFTHDI